MSFSNKVKTLLNWSKNPAPKINLNNELYQELKPFRLPVILTITMMMVGTLGYIAIDGFSLNDAIYQTGITFTTVGFGEMAPISTAGRFFTISLIILGFGVFSFSIGILVEVLNKGEFVKLFKERQMLYKIARLKNHFVICHHNNITIELSKQFRENHIPFVVIDANENIEKIAQKYKYPYFIQEDPHTELALQKACLSSAKGLITLSENTADNIAQIATTRLYEKELGLKRAYFIMANANDESDIDKLTKLGANTVISPTKLMAQRLSAVSMRPDLKHMMENILYRKDNPIDIEEIEVPEHSWMVSRQLKETYLRDIVNVSVVGVRDKKDNFTSMPKGNFKIEEGFKLLVIGTGEGIRGAKRIIRKKDKPEEIKDV
ncbi:MAG: NAD-binding protein [Sulfurospirillaceae bacterium]|nr:NAD-binding protein [Sulfurospirillaceae bacterium]